MPWNWCTEYYTAMLVLFVFCWNVFWICCNSRGSQSRCRWAAALSIVCVYSLSWPCCSVFRFELKMEVHHLVALTFCHIQLLWFPLSGGFIHACFVDMSDWVCAGALQKWRLACPKGPCSVGCNVRNGLLAGYKTLLICNVQNIAPSWMYLVLL